MKAEYVQHMGTDLTVVNAARVSFDKESDWEDVPCAEEDCWCDGFTISLKEGDKKLIKYLASHGHWTPFSHATITLRETIPIFVARQRFKHMVGFTYNEVSRRYVDDTPEFFEPEVWRGRPVGAKQGSSDVEITEGIEYQYVKTPWDSFHTSITASPKFVLEHVHSVALNGYHSLLEGGVAPEQARMVLPQSMYTSYYVTGSLYAFAHAYALRIDPHAQKEIQELAKQWDLLIRPLFPVSWEALVE